MSTDLAQLASDRYEIADTLHRYCFGLDQGDPDSLASALTEDCIFDFTPAGRKLGLNFPRLTSRQAIIDAVLPLIGPLDTSHTCSNLQIEISVLSLPQPIRPEHIVAGRHGLIVTQGSRRGLLLPQVAEENGWDAQTFLAQTCVKAGLPADAWQQGATIEAFTAEVFGE